MTFKEDICKCLEESKFFDKSIEGIIDDKDMLSEKKKGKGKEKSARWIPSEEENLDEVNFLKMTAQEMALKVPTLKRIDEARYIQFKLEPLPKAIKEKTNLVSIPHNIHPQYHSCFES